MEKWDKVYNKEVEIYDAFSSFEDEGNLVWKRFVEECSFKDKVVLDIGCGSGKYINLISPYCQQYLALDISEPILNLAKRKHNNLENVEYIHASSELIPVEDETIDVVFSSWGIEREVIETTMKEIERVIKEGGDIWFFVNSPMGEFMDLRGPSAIKFDREFLDLLTNRYRFQIVTTVSTNFKFPDLKTAKYILNFIFGERASEYLGQRDENNCVRLGHEVAILHKKYTP